MRIFKSALVIGAATIALASAANATVNVSASPGGSPYTGPTPTYDFDTSTPVYSGGAVVGPGTTGGAFAQPVGSTGHYYSVGPSTSTPGTITLGSNIGSFSFIWGSIDTYNALTLITSAGSYTYTGSYIASLIPTSANGNQVGAATNPIVTFALTGLDQMGVSFQMSSTQNAFEIDNIAVNAVPEPGTWAMMLLGFGAIGFAIRRRKSSALTQLA